MAIFRFWFYKNSVPPGLKTGTRLDRFIVTTEWIKTVERASLGPRIATFPEARWKEVASALLDQD
jgi:hypothetical protein